MLIYYESEYIYMYAMHACMYVCMYNIIMVFCSAVEKYHTIHTICFFFFVVFASFWSVIISFISYGITRSKINSQMRRSKALEIDYIECIFNVWMCEDLPVSYFLYRAHTHTHCIHIFFYHIFCMNCTQSMRDI